MARCVECGFLGLRNSATGHLDIANEGFRREGYINQQQHYALPICEQGVLEFRTEANPGRQEMILAAIQKDRPCDRAMKWHPSLTPSEHANMQIAETIRAESERREKETREWQQRREEQSAKEMREWQQRGEEKAKSNRQEERREERAWQERQQVRNSIRAVIAGVVTALIVSAITWAAGKLNAPPPSPSPPVAAPAPK